MPIRPIRPEDPIDALPPLRRRRRPVNIARLASLVSRGVREVEATIEPVARHWDAHNAAALAAEGPLWVALGDSVTQGIGASTPAASYPALVLDELRASSGAPWRLVNLSMSGARFADVVDHQLRVLRDHGMTPALVTALIGSNDVIWRRDTAAIVADARRLVAHLPPDTVLSRVSETPPDRRRRGINQVFTAAAARGHVQLYDAWRFGDGTDRRADRPERPDGREGPPGLADGSPRRAVEGDRTSGDGLWAADRFHPADRAHRYLAENLLRVVRGATPER